MHDNKTLLDLLIEELCELHDIECRFLQLFPRIIAAATDDDLKRSLAGHRDQIAEHLRRAGPALNMLGVTRADSAGRCVALIFHAPLPEEADCSSSTADARLIALVMKIEHYLNAGYLNTCVQARVLGLDEIASLLQLRVRTNSSLLLHMPLMAGPFAEMAEKAAGLS